MLAEPSVKGRDPRDSLTGTLGQTGHAHRANCATTACLPTVFPGFSKPLFVFARRARHDPGELCLSWRMAWTFVLLGQSAAGRHRVLMHILVQKPSPALFRPAAQHAALLDVLKSPPLIRLYRFTNNPKFNLSCVQHVICLCRPQADDRENGRAPPTPHPTPPPHRQSHNSESLARASSSSWR